MQQYNLQDLQAFVSVVETGSFNQAAERLQASTAAVSRRVSALETALGIRLLHRTTRKLHLTDAGEQYYLDVQHILDALQESEERLREGSTVLRGKLRIAAPLSFGVQKISPLLPGFLRQHPDIELDLQLEDRETDLYAQGVDLALRIGKLRDSALVATRLCAVNFVCCAAPDYLAQHGEPTHPDQLAEHHCLRYSLISRKQEWGMVSDNIPLRSTLAVNNGEVLRDAALQGSGIALLPHFIVGTPLAEGQLMPILTEFTPRPTHLYALRLSRHYTPVRVIRFIEYLRENLV